MGTNVPRGVGVDSGQFTEQLFQFQSFSAIECAERNGPISTMIVDQAKAIMLKCYNTRCAGISITLYRSNPTGSRRTFGRIWIQVRPSLPIEAFEFFLNNTNLTFLTFLYKIDITGFQNQQI